MPEKKTTTKKANQKTTTAAKKKVKKIATKKATVAVVKETKEKKSTAKKIASATTTAPPKTEGGNTGDDKARTRIRIRIMAYDNKVIDKSTKTIIDTARRSGAEVVGPVPLPTHIKKFTLLRSTFVHKDSRDQYEIRTHKRLIDIYEPTNKTMEDLTSLSLPAGVDVEIKM